MASPEEVLHMLDESLKMEISAEENCQKLIDTAKLNGFTESVEHIKNDEHLHQAIVKEIQAFMKR